MSGSDIGGLSFFLLAGLAGTPHCLAMCGPLLCGFSSIFRDAACGAPAPVRPLGLSLAAYHAGRLWTYSLLGFGAGWVGQAVQSGTALANWQEMVSIAVGASLIAVGLWLFGFLPQSTARGPWLQVPVRFLRNAASRLAATPSLIARFLIGVLMGFIPCGMLYAMLIPAATFAHPLMSAVGMLVFGIGTLPALSAAHLLVNLFPPLARLQRRLITPVLFVLMGCFIVYRATAG